MTDCYSTGTRWQDTVAAVIPTLPYPTRQDGDRQRAQWPDGLLHLEPTTRDGLVWSVDSYLDGSRS